MTYAAVPDHRIPYDNDGTVVAVGEITSGVVAYPSGSSVIYINGMNNIGGSYATNGVAWTPGDTTSRSRVWLFFPEQREVTGFFLAWSALQNGAEGNTFGFNAAMMGAGFSIEGSNDTTNGIDGTWETASLPGGANSWTDVYSWRPGIKAVSFTGGKRTIRFTSATFITSASTRRIAQLHLYGEKVAGQTPDDIIFIDHDTTPGVEYSSVEDFGDRPLGTTVVRQFRVKNVSPSLTANAINLQCNDADFAISTDGVVWVVTINIASLAAGAESATMFIRNTTPAPGAPLGPRFARIVAIVGSWT